MTYRARITFEVEIEAPSIAHARRLARRCKLSGQHVGGMRMAKTRDPMRTGLAIVAERVEVET